MDGGQSGGTFGTVIMNNNIHCDYANCHITSTAAAQCLTGEHFDPLLIFQVPNRHTWNTITSFRWLTYVLRRREFRRPIFSDDIAQHGTISAAELCISILQESSKSYILRANAITRLRWLIYVL